REYGEAERTLTRGLELSRSLSLQGELTNSFLEPLHFAHWAQRAEHLHALTEQLRFQVNIQPGEELLRLEEPCRRIWDVRGQLLERADWAAGKEQVDEIQQRIQSDLLDLAILWTNMRIELAPAEDKELSRITLNAYVSILLQHQPLPAAAC